ncbi:4269_t:CDS:2 [Acaulospora colombiana]|uniref:4269_t:CDS:1 n=1 Tax=Acaulospora colombiana TaxID=27376 RepID=A0ACA9K111_9GLOM|nr:4269_t:CDS:2 [Acaulospora colombiana]
MTSGSWEPLMSSAALSLFKDEEGRNEHKYSPKGEVKEESLTRYSSWSELKEATLNDDDDCDNDVALTSQGEIKVPPSAAVRFKHDDILCGIYGCNPLKDENGTVKCNECSKKLSPQGFIEHAESCERLRENPVTATVKIPPVHDASANKNTKNNVNTVEFCNPNKKRKRSVNSEVEVMDPSISNKSLSPSGIKPPPEKKQKPKKEEKKKKTTGRNKGPVDLDKHCGVIAPPSNTPCTRSLTCKSHSVALKRAVQGRSQLYDLLLAQYQKKSIGRPQNNGVANKQENGKKDGKNELSEKDEGPIDSEQEVDSVMEALMCSKPQPIVTRQDSYVPPTSSGELYDTNAEKGDNTTVRMIRILDNNAIYDACNFVFETFNKSTLPE